MDADEAVFWKYADEMEYTYIKERYSDRKSLMEEASNKLKAFKETEPNSRMYHRIAVSAEMAKMRVDMAYVIDKNTKLEEMLGTVAFLHQRIDILEGAYSHIKIVAEKCRIEYGVMASMLKDMKKLREDMTNEVKQRSDVTDGPTGDVLPRQGG